MCDKCSFGPKWPFRRWKYPEEFKLPWRLRVLRAKDLPGLPSVPPAGRDVCATRRWKLERRRGGRERRAEQANEPVSASCGRLFDQAILKN